MEINIIDIISLTASLASLLLAIIAIWLSFKFYKMTTEASDKTIEASKEIDSSVLKLEKLFDKLYSDTFTMMKDTVSDMRKHIWNADYISDENSIEKELEQKTQEKIDKLKTDISNDISSILNKQINTESKITDLGNEITNIVTRAVAKTRNIETEVKEETLRDFILQTFNILRKTRKRITVDSILEKALENNISPKEIIEELFKMKEDNILHYEGDKINTGILEIKLK